MLYSFKTDEEAEEEMRGLTILATYGNHGLYRIDEFDFKKKPSDIFTLDDGTKISYKEYFEKRYKVKISKAN